MMGNCSLRCCLACVIPCGSLDLIRVVHINGHVDEYSRPLPASEVLAAHPRHVLTAPSSRRRILLVSPDSHLRRGQIYFLIPESSLPAAASSSKNKHRHQSNYSTCRNNRQQQQQQQQQQQPMKTIDAISSQVSHADDHGYVEYNYDQVRVRRRTTSAGKRRSGRVGAWRPHLQSITEDL